MAPFTTTTDIAEDEPSQHPNTSGKWSMGSGTHEVTRRASQHLLCVHQALFRWHTNTHKQDYPYSCFTGITLLPDTPLTTIASNHCLKVLDDLQTALVTSWGFIEAYGKEVLALVKKDKEDKDIQAMKALTNHQAKCQATEAAKATQDQTVDTKPTSKGV
ncbi:hypothetical protein BS17DRAFT_821715 [Gyrodon lividus]|nr:hypothetical protein BS17DRAFT_821715 [Gyrodon lividus]